MADYGTIAALFTASTSNMTQVTWGSYAQAAIIEDIPSWLTIDGKQITYITVGVNNYENEIRVNFPEVMIISLGGSTTKTMVFSSARFDGNFAKYS